jgi:hypothetical protein
LTAIIAGIAAALAFFIIARIALAIIIAKVSAFWLIVRCSYIVVMLIFFMIFHKGLLFWLLSK